MSYAGIQPDAAGKKIDLNDGIVEGADTVYRQRMVVADDAAGAGVAKVTNAAPGAADYGLVGRVLLYGPDGNPVSYAKGADLGAGNVNARGLLDMGSDYAISVNPVANPMRVDSQGMQYTTLSTAKAIAAGIAATVTGYGNLRVTPEANAVFTDPFDGSVIDTARWTTGGTVVPVQAAGVMNLAPGTTASAWSRLQSVPSFPPAGNAFLALGAAVQLESPVTTNTHRFWGWGIAPTTPTAAAPLTDAIGFEIATDGNLYGVVYAAGTRFATAAIATKPTDGQYHRYLIVYRADTILFYVDDTSAPVTSLSFRLPDVATLPLLFQQVNSTAAPTANTFKFLAIGMSDTGRPAAGITDGTYPHRKATVDAAGNLGVAGTMNMMQVGGVATSAFPAGFMRTSDEPVQLFYDPFDTGSFDAQRWNAPVNSGAGASSLAGGNLTVQSGTTAGGYSYVTSVPSFLPTVPAWLGNSWAMQLEAGATFGNNSVRFWGHGTVGGTPSVTSPLGATGNGYGFEIGTDGVLYAVMYANGVRTIVATLSDVQPTDGAMHRYILYYRTDRTFWYIDGIGSANLVATSNFQGPAVQGLPVLILSVAGTTPPAASRAIVSTGMAVWDTGKNVRGLSDGTYPWRKATIKPASTAPVATDTALVVAPSPNSQYRLGDGTNAVAVKAASTVPVAADPALVVALSPNSVVSNVPDTAATGTLNAINATVVVAVAGKNSVGFNIPAGHTLVGTVLPEVSMDGGTTWSATLFDTLNGAKALTQAVATGVAYQITVVLPGGASHARVRVSAFTSGTATGNLRATETRDPSVLFSQPIGTAVIADQPVTLNGGRDATGLAQVVGVRTLPTGGTGLPGLAVNPNATQLLTYIASNRAIVTAALTANTARPIFSLHHLSAATKTVKIRRILIGGIQTTALVGLLDVQLTRGTTATTAGTAVVPGPMLPGDAASEAVATSLPTIVAATIVANIPFSGVATAVANAQPGVIVYDWQESGETKPLTLRAGVLESLVINVVSTAAQNWTLTVSVVFTEE